MSKSRFVLDKFAKLIEEGLVSYSDISEEILNILKSKRDQLVFRMKLASKEEFEVLDKRVSRLEQKFKEIKKNKVSKKTKKAKKP